MPKPLGFDLYTNVGYIELDFLGVFERELSSENMFFSNNGDLHGENLRLCGMPGVMDQL